jgi:hypothetical protein
MELHVTTVATNEVNTPLDASKATLPCLMSRPVSFDIKIPKTAIRCLIISF